MILIFGILQDQVEECSLSPAGGGSTSTLKYFQVGVDCDEDPSGLEECFKLPESCHVEPFILEIYKYCKPRRDISGYNDSEMSRLTLLKEQAN